MAISTASFSRDANFVPMVTDGFITKKTITFAGGTTDAWGDDGGALDGAALFTVTGVVRARIFGICTTDLAGTGTHAIGIAGATTIYLPTEVATDINAGDFVANNAVVGAHLILGAQDAAASNFPLYALNGQDIIMTIATADITSGVIDYYCVWVPWSSDGNVVDSGL
jgi:hypothetical protein